MQAGQDTLRYPIPIWGKRQSRNRHDEDGWEVREFKMITLYYVTNGTTGQHLHVLVPFPTTLSFKNA
jgi:hypothetical protein